MSDQESKPMTEEEKRQAVINDVSESISTALFKAQHSRGVVIAIAMDDDSIWFHTSGELVTKLGLILALRQKADTMSESIGPESDIEGKD